MNLARHQRALRRVQRVLERLLDETAGSVSIDTTNYRVWLWEAKAAVLKAATTLERRPS